jgi:hypothetical protein
MGMNRGGVRPPRNAHTAPPVAPRHRPPPPHNFVPSNPFPMVGGAPFMPPPPPPPPHYVGAGGMRGGGRGGRGGRGGGAPRGEYVVAAY